MIVRTGANHNPRLHASGLAEPGRRDSYEGEFPFKLEHTKLGHSNLDRQMSSKDPRNPPSKVSREERLAKALRENLARRKALVRAKRDRANAETAAPSEDENAGPDKDDDFPA